MDLTVTSPASPERVFEFLANPRNLVIANNPGPVVERSVEAGGVGSWTVLAFDNLRARVEYTAWEPPTRIAAVVSWSGRFSGGRRDEAEYRLAPVSGGGTAVTIAGQSNVRAIPLAGRLNTWLITRRLRRRFAAIS
jgi:uncharacterized protein YndB with AHSA1/START domain